MTSNNIQGFRVLPLRFSSSCTSFHNLFVKQHSVRTIEDLKPPGKTLFVINVPPYVTENDLKVCFSKAGCVEYVIFENDNENISNNGFKRAFVVFEKRESLLKAMVMETLDSLSSDRAPLKVGLERWIEDYNFGIYNPNDLQKKINTFMANYDKQEERERKTDKDEAVDNEGWTVVIKKGRNPGISRKESVELKLNEKGKAWSKKKQLKNFYTFQIRESKMEHIAVLRKSFEEAKNKINLMKKTRKFKPY